MPKAASHDKSFPDPGELPWVFGFRGASDAATARVGPLLLWQIAIGLVAGLIAGWLVWRVACPVIQRALDNLPPGIIRITGGRLDWPELGGRQLSENGFLALAADPAGDAANSQAADLQCTFGPRHLTASGLLGSVLIRYPAGMRLEFDRIEALAWWGAWKWVCLLGIVLGTLIALLALWWILVAAYVVPVWLLAGVCGRTLTPGGAGKMAGASLLTGAVVMCGGLLLYGLRLIAVPGLTVATGLHLVVGWGTLLGGLVQRPGRMASGVHSFGPPPPAAGVAAFARTSQRPRSKNPFGKNGPPD
ncbi:MAG: hypothetical protein EXS36_19505 [Pedosphaera sp.]|nr:hypothetical protein [Pedosphaera sp.]